MSVKRTAAFTRSAAGPMKTARRVSRPSKIARAATTLPTECAMRPPSGPWCAATAPTAATICGIVTRPTSDAPCPGASKATTEKPRATRGSTNAPSCAPRPPQPWTSSTLGPLPHVHVST